jgi:hypothetical protein
VATATQITRRVVRFIVKALPTRELVGDVARARSSVVTLAKNACPASNLVRRT